MGVSLKIKIIVVSPKYQMNLGYIARISKNFGVDELSIVKPRAKVTGGKAIMFSKHASKLLTGAHIYNTLTDAANECDVLIGTTGIWRTMPRIKAYLIDDVVEKLKKYGKSTVVGIVLGRDDTGLTRDELEECDMVLHIPTDKEYHVLNISHALAIVLYSLKRNEFVYKKSEIEKPNPREIKLLFEVFGNNIKDKKIRDRKMVRRIFERVIRNAQLSKEELHALITALK